jgi:hypothetical protein
MRQTNSPLTVGIPHCCFNQGLVAFFQRAPNGLIRNRLDHAACDEAIRQQL